MDVSEQYRARLKMLLEKRFAGFDIVLRDSYSRLTPGKAIDFVYKGVECMFGFYDCKGKLVFTMDLETPKKEGLVKRMQDESPSGKKIEEFSKFLLRPYREVAMDSEASKTHYSLHCMAKQNLRNLDPQKNPENADGLIKDIWSYLMKIPIGLATGILK